MPKYARSPAPNPIPLANLGRYPLYRIKVPPDFLDLLVGATLGNRYHVLSVIGRGGMSVVYKAKEINTGLIFAVKTLRTHSLTDEMVVKRFQREAELLNRLNHPRIVNLHAYGTSSRGQPYFVMDFLVGDNLVTVLKNEDHLDPERFQDIFVQVCAAIEHAHKHGAIHRDIKPGNIMLTRKKQTRDYVKVVDFGIAKLAEEAQKLTRMGEVWGSPIYMSPEQCMGAAIDARSDIYSLGIVMYEALTGKVPFLGRNYADTMGKQITEVPPTFAQVRPDVKIPASLEVIVMKALAKEANDRYQSLTEMRKDLESALSAQPANPAQSYPPGVSGNFGKEVKAARAGRTGNQLKPPVEPSPKASMNKMKPPPAASQSKSNLRSQTLNDIEKPRRNSATRARMDAAIIDPNRVRNLILIAVGSLIVTGSLIAVFTNGPAATALLANVLKQIIGGGAGDGDMTTDQNNGQNSGQNSYQTSDQTGGTAGNAGNGAGNTNTSAEDPQQALQKWLTPGGGSITSGEPGSFDNMGQSGQGDGQKNGGIDDQAERQREIDQQREAEQREQAERDQAQREQDQQRDAEQR